jgi:flagellar protein FliO/FliZ
MNGDYSLQFFAALIFVLGLISALAYALRRWGGSALLLPRSGARRLAIVETLPLDSTRRLVLLRRDDREHLVMIGRNQDVLIEAGIERRAGTGDGG